MQVRLEQRCWQKRKVREEDSNIKRRSKIRGYSNFDRYIFIYEFRQCTWYLLRKLTALRYLRDYGGLTEALKNDRQ